MEAAVDREWVESVATDLVDDGRAGIECNEVEPVDELDTESSSGIGVFLISFPLSAKIFLKELSALLILSFTFEVMF